VDYFGLNSYFDVFVFSNQLHFEQSQFEKERVDGRKKLKFNAVPSIWVSYILLAHYYPPNLYSTFVY